MLYVPLIWTQIPWTRLGLPYTLSLSWQVSISHLLSILQTVFKKLVKHKYSYCHPAVPSPSQCQQWTIKNPMLQAGCCQKAFVSVLKGALILIKGRWFLFVDMQAEGVYSRLKNYRHFHYWNVCGMLRKCAELRRVQSRVLAQQRPREYYASRILRVGVCMGDETSLTYCERGYCVFFPPTIRLAQDYTLHAALHRNCMCACFGGWCVGALVRWRMMLVHV